MFGNHRGRGGGFGPTEVLNHTQMLRQGDRAAEALRRLGVGAGDPVPVLLPMGLESIVVTLACIELSALRITLPLGKHPALVRDRLRTSGARLVISADACRIDGRTHATKSDLDRALQGCPDVRDVLVVRQLARPVPWMPGRDRWWHELLAAGTLPPRPYPGGMSDPEQWRRPRPEPRARLVFDDPLERRSADDADHGWGEPPPEESRADLARFLSEKPPHHL